MEPFKDSINSDVIETIGDIFKRIWPSFDRTGFIDKASASLTTLELKERVMQVAHALDETLPADFADLSATLLSSLHPSEDTDRDEIQFGPGGICNRAIWPLTELVVIRGLDHPIEALDLLKEMTKRFTSEFAVRPFLDKWPEVALPIFHEWASDPNRHVRRLASEGSRPRLPWGMRLQSFVNDPTPLLAILEALKDDPEEYVRRSVANNLNDIAKDHPDLVSDLAERWLKDASKNRQRLVKHACRTLIKQGHPAALSAFGYKPLASAEASLTLHTPKVTYGGAIEFTLTLSDVPVGSNLMIDYAVHFVKANGTRSPKVFKWKDMQLSGGGDLVATRAHAIKPITTRKFYPGQHLIEIAVNGQSVAHAEFDLIMP